MSGMPVVQGQALSPCEQAYYGMLNNMLVALNKAQKMSIQYGKAQNTSGALIATTEATTLMKQLRNCGELVFDQDAQKWSLCIESEESTLILDGE